MTAPDPRLDAIKDRLGAATPGPWGWFGNTDTKSIQLATIGRGRQFIMTFRRWGMQGAQPWFNTDMMMSPASDRPRYEVAPAAESRDDPRVYRADISGIKHPDAEFIANAPADVAYLLSVVEAQAGQIAKASDLIADLTDSGTCWFDHHGGCQEHGYLFLEPGQTCPQQDAKDWTAALAPEGPET